MASVYSTQFFGGALAGDETHNLYEVPTGYVAVVRDVSLFSQSSGSNGCYAGSDAGYAYFSALDQPQYASPHWEGRVVMNAGEVMTLGIFSGDWTCVISGYLLTSPGT